VAGIHWWYFHSSHAAELTAGYYNLDTQTEQGIISNHVILNKQRSIGSSTGYDAIASMIASHKNAQFLFTCLEMQDAEQGSECECGPYELVGQTKTSAMNVNIHYSGENALERYDQTAYDTIKTQATRYGEDIHKFTYLRLSSTLTDDWNNWNTFEGFVNDMKSL